MNLYRDYLRYFPKLISNVIFLPFFQTILFNPDFLNSFDGFDLIKHFFKKYMPQLAKKLK